jgi:hypothetical protein
MVGKLRGPRDAVPAKAGGRTLFAPRWLVSVDAQFNLQSYSICLHWTGRRTLVPGTLPVGEACYLVLHPTLPFRRKLQRFPSQARAREVLLRAAPDEFPLDKGDGVSYCLGLRQGEGYVYALPGEIHDQLVERGLKPSIVLVGSSEVVDETDCLATLSTFEQLGAALAFGGRRRPLSRRWLLDLPLAGGAALALGLMLWLAVNDPFAEVLGAEQARLRRETAGVAEQYAATENMLATRSHLARLRESPGAQLPAELDKLWQGIPAGHAIRRIEYKEGQLKISGSGLEVGKWLESSGFAPEKITTETAGKLTRFRAERPLGQ